MKAAFSYPAITIVSLAFTAICNAQNNPIVLSPGRTDTIKKKNNAPVIAASSQTDSLKITKKKKRRKEQPDGVNPYLPYTPDGKPLPYNSGYRASRIQPYKPDSLGGEILKAIIDKKHH